MNVRKTEQRMVARTAARPTCDSSSSAQVKLAFPPAAPRKPFAACEFDEFDPKRDKAATQVSRRRPQTTAALRTNTTSGFGWGFGRGWHEAFPVASQSHRQTGLPEGLVAERAQHVVKRRRRVLLLQARTEERAEVLVKSDGDNDLCGGIRAWGPDLQPRRKTGRRISPAVEQRKIDDSAIEVLRRDRELRTLRGGRDSDLQFPGLCLRGSG